MSDASASGWLDWRRLPWWGRVLLVLAALAFACVLPEFAFLIDLGGIDLAVGFVLAGFAGAQLRLRLWRWQAENGLRVVHEALRSSWLAHPGGWSVGLASGVVALLILANQWALPLALWPALWPRM